MAIHRTYKSIIKMLTLLSAIVILVGTIVPFVDSNYRINYGEAIIWKFIFVGYCFLLFSLVLDLHLYLQNDETPVIAD